MRRHLLIIVGLIALVVAAFWGLAACGFVNFDDPVYIINNPHVTTGLTWNNVRWAWTTFYAGNYLPLTWLSLMLDVRLFGSAPRGFHWVNLAFHTANAILIYFWFYKATGAAWRSAFVAAIFAVHPLRVESVAWVVERKDVLTTFFALLAMLAYLRFASTSKWRWYAAVLLLFAAALLAKQTLSTLPFLLLLLDYWPLGRWIRGPIPCNALRAQVPRRMLARLTLEKVPLLLLVAAIAAVTMKAQSSTDSVISFSVLPLGFRICNVPVSYVRYLGKMVWFGNLAIFYPIEIWSSLQIGAACAVLLAISALAFAKIRSAPWLTIGWLWFLGVLFPMIGLVQFSTQAMADRFTYFSGIGVLVMVVWSIPAWIARRMPLFTAAAAAALLGTLCLFTIAQTSYWRDSITLFSHDIQVAGGNVAAENNLGWEMVKKGDYAGAIPHLREAVRHAPRLVVVRCNLGNALAQTGQLDEAYIEAAEAKRLNPSDPNAYILSAHVLNRQKKYQAAESNARTAIKLDTNLPGAYNNLGIALWHMGKLDAAAEQFNRALIIAPGFVAAQENLEKIHDLQQAKGTAKLRTGDAGNN